MSSIDVSQINKIYFLGIGGIGMSAIARMMHHEGRLVIGSDTDNNKIVQDLRSEGYLIHIGQDIENIPNDVDVIVYSEAVEDYHPKFLDTVREHFNVPVISYPQMLGAISNNTVTIAVTGSHGKTTTTGMISSMLVDTGKNPTAIIGSILAREQSNYIAGSKDLFVVEACEYKRSFLNLHPNILVITNIEADHLDYYKDLDDVKSAFKEMVGNVPEDGTIIARMSDPIVQEVLTGATQTVIDYAEHIDDTLGLRVPSLYNFENAACALSVAQSLGIEEVLAKQSLENFQGTWRRFQYKGVGQQKELIYDDYAHHPTEVRGVLAAAKKMFPDREIVVIFEPHLFSRTKALFDEFVASFVDADRVLLAPIYFAREDDDGSISSQMLGDAIAQTGKKVFVGRSYDHIVDYISTTETTDAVIMTIGAGPVYHVADKLVALK
jgi:UDP-N-acetylmuramate--alanine ligase